jgi:pyridoxal 5'-phosphate synthase pdxT subunit
MKIGVLALQGDFKEHAQSLTGLCVEAPLVRFPEELARDEIDGLIIPGGESTAIARLTEDGGTPLFNAILQRAREGMPIYGTCMGSIFLASEIEGSSQGRLALMDLKVRRNAFGPQRRSFESSIYIDDIEEPTRPFPAIFIRAPLFLSCGESVKVLARLPESEGFVMARQDNLLVSAFHPEITADLRVHKYFVKMVESYLSGRAKTPGDMPLNCEYSSGAGVGRF